MSSLIIIINGISTYLPLFLFGFLGLENETAEEKALGAQLAQRINDHFEFLKPYVNCLLGLIPAQKVREKLKIAQSIKVFSLVAFVPGRAVSMAMYHRGLWAHFRKAIGSQQHG